MDQSKWDETAITSAYDDLLEKISHLLDTIKINGFSTVFSSLPFLSRFIELLTLMEEELLIQWKLREEGGLEAVFSRHRNWLNVELRSNGGFFDTYNDFVSELWRLSTNDTPLSGQDLWQTQLIRWLTDTDTLATHANPFFQTTGQTFLDRYAEIVHRLTQLSPYHLCLSFLNLIEIGAGPRPEILDAGSGTESKNTTDDFSGVRQLFFDITTAPTSRDVSERLNKFWDKASGGIYSLYPAFLVQKQETVQSFDLHGVTPSNWIRFDQLIGIDKNRDILLKNTQRFIDDQPAHHVLLWGGRGTGKSSSVMALLETFRTKGLRLLEIQQKDLDLVPDIEKQLREKREKFILFCDDLSFDKDDAHYKHLKTVMEGSLAGKPNNILIIATANRKDLVFRGDLDERMPEQKQLIDEKRAIDDRFGLKLFYDVPVFKQLSEILYFYADATGLDYDADELLRTFRQFAQNNNHDNPAGRTVKQFIQEWTLSRKRD